MKEELLTQVESKFTEDSKTIWATKDHLEVLLSQIESCQAFSECYQKQGSEGQILSLLNQLLHRLTELDSAVGDTSVIFSSTTPLTDFNKSVLNLSSLGTLSVAKDATFTQGSLKDTAEIYEDEKTTLVYILNEPLAHLVKWECKYGHNNKLKSTCPIVVASDNQIEIEFTPTISGTYSFQLIPTGCPIVGIQKFTVTLKQHLSNFEESEDDIFHPITCDKESSESSCDEDSSVLMKPKLKTNVTYLESSESSYDEETSGLTTLNVKSTQPKRKKQNKIPSASVLQHSIWPTFNNIEVLQTTLRCDGKKSIQKKKYGNQDNGASTVAKFKKHENLNPRKFVPLRYSFHY